MIDAKQAITYSALGASREQYKQMVLVEDAVREAAAQGERVATVGFKVHIAVKDTLEAMGYKVKYTRDYDGEFDFSYDATLISW